MALPYTRSDVKDRVRAEWRGACNVTLPSFSQDFTGLNEAGIAHDVRRAAEQGFWGTLIASESGTTTDEYCRFMHIAAEAAPPGFKLMHHASFTTLDEMLVTAREAESLGFEATLMSYPPTFRPKAAQEIVEFTRHYTQQTNLATVLFGVMTWGFKSLHPSGFPPEALEEMAKFETAAAIKYEANPPAMPTGLADTLRRCGK
ncbi:MAG: dihydrodipicolinate synthase family protein, partial [Chloroflexi bacterium]|nr:dihydrodipicolinate synthase family protein [Chloroflexota bacterium]